MTTAMLKNICYTPYNRKLKLHEINPDFKNSRLIMSFIFVYVNFRDLNFYYFGPGQIFPSYVYGKSHEQSVHSIWIIRWSLSLFVSQQVLFFVNVPLISFILKCHPLRKCLFRVNFLYSNVFSHFDIRDNLSRVNFQCSTYISWSVDFLS